MWHSHQFCVHGIRNRQKLNVLVSRSRDGEIIADVVEKWGFKTIRGSKGKKGAVEATMQMITALKNGENCAMMVDGPRGPAKIVKEGVIKVAELSDVPIVPVYWYSANFNFVQFPSWDKLRMPIFDVNLINLYGKPIYASNYKTENDARLALQRELDDLEIAAPIVFNKIYKFGRIKLYDLNSEDDL
ncbi:DUF374 domain-containing protein [bacterium]|nr:DUF374 domain-containing protein [bacterium]